MTAVLSQLEHRERASYVGNLSPEIQEISIIIPVRNDSAGINRLLDAIEELSDYSLVSEVLIVDNNSSPPLELTDRTLSSSNKVKLLSCTKRGPASARNVGASVATSEWLLFIDSDCIPHHNLIEEYLQMQNCASGYAGGVKSFGKDDLSAYYESQEILVPPPGANGDPSYLVTANALIWKQAFHLVGGFNEDIAIAGGEDIDLALRLKGVGRLSFSRNATVYHDFRGGWMGFIKRFLRYGVGNRMISTIHQIDLKPKPFLPNVKTPLNLLAAVIQFTAMTVGYHLSFRIKG